MQNGSAGQRQTIGGRIRGLRLHRESERLEKVPDRRVLRRVPADRPDFTDAEFRDLTFQRRLEGELDRPVHHPAAHREVDDRRTVEMRVSDQAFVAEPVLRANREEHARRIGREAPHLVRRVADAAHVELMRPFRQLGDARAFVGADRMEAPSANAFLKLLEEPPAKTMFLLLTDAPDMILPTIVSRSQRVDLRLSAGVLADADRGEIEAIFSANGIRGTFAKSQAARTLAEVYEDLKTRVEEDEGDLPAMRKAFFKTIMHFVRQWMVAKRLPEYQVFHDLGAVEEAYRQVSERSMQSEAVLSFMCDRMFFPE